MRPLVSSVNGRPNLDNLVAVDIMAIDPALLEFATVYFRLSKKKKVVGST